VWSIKFTLGKQAGRCYSARNTYYIISFCCTDRLELSYGTSALDTD